MWRAYNIMQINPRYILESPNPLTVEMLICEDARFHGTIEEARIAMQALEKNYPFKGWVLTHYSTLKVPERSALVSPPPQEVTQPVAPLEPPKHVKKVQFQEDSKISNNDNKIGHPQNYNKIGHPQNENPIDNNKIGHPQNENPITDNEVGHPQNDDLITKLIAAISGNLVTTVSQQEDLDPSHLLNEFQLSQFDTSLFPDSPFFVWAQQTATKLILNDVQSLNPQIDTNGETPLHHIARGAWDDFFSLVIEKTGGACPDNMKEIWGFAAATILFNPPYNGCIDLENTERKTAIALAKEADQDSVVKVLTKAKNLFAAAPRVMQPLHPVTVEVLLGDFPGFEKDVDSAKTALEVLAYQFPNIDLSSKKELTLQEQTTAFHLTQEQKILQGGSGVGANSSSNSNSSAKRSHEEATGNTRNVEPPAKKIMTASSYVPLSVANNTVTAKPYGSHQFLNLKKAGWDSKFLFFTAQVKHYVRGKNNAEETERISPISARNFATKFAYRYRGYRN